MDRRFFVGWSALIFVWLGFVVAVFVVLPSVSGRVQSWAAWSFIGGVAVAVCGPRVYGWVTGEREKARPTDPGRVR